MDDLERERSRRIRDLLERAKRSSNKGRYYVYESYKQDLLRLNPTREEYEQTCRQLAYYLKV